MPATWPAELPQTILISGNRLGTADGRLRTPTDKGPGKVRRRSSAMAAPLGGSVLLTAAQKAILDDFVATELVGGTLPFEFPDVLAGSGTLLVRFAESLPSYTYAVDDGIEAQLSLEVLL